MDFIRSLDAADVGVASPESAFPAAAGAAFPSSSFDDGPSAAQTFAAALGYRPTKSTTRPASAPWRHQPIKHRPSALFHQVEFEPDPPEEEEDFEATTAAMRRSASQRVVGSNLGAAEATSVQRYLASTTAELAARDTGDYFREAEQDLVPPESGCLAGVGPGKRNRIHAGALPRSTLTALDGFKTRDLFASQARRTKTTREQVVFQAAKDPTGFRYRTSADHVLDAKKDFPTTKRQDVGYQAGPDADIDSYDHPDVRLGLHKFRPNVDEKRLEAQVAALSAQHMKRRLAAQTLTRSVTEKVEAFGRGLERREEETMRKQEDSYRQMFQQKEQDERTKKSRPVSAPMMRVRKSSKAAPSVSTASSSSLAVPEESAEEEEQEEEADGFEDTPSPASRTFLTQAERDRLDPRTAISHPDVQLLQDAAAKAAHDHAASGASLPAGFSARPSTAGKLRIARWAEEGATMRSGAAGGRPASAAVQHVHGPGCGHAHHSSGQFDVLSSGSTTTTTTTSTKQSASRPASAAPVASSPATELLHRHRPGSAALSLYNTSLPVSSLPVPAELIDQHFKAEAWSMARREEYEIDALTRQMADLPSAHATAQGGGAADDAEDTSTIVFEDSIAGAAAARMKHELRLAEKKRLKEEARAAAAAEVARAREQLRYKTDVWEAHTLGIVPLGETEKDHTLAAIKARQLALARAGLPVSAKVPTHDVAFNSGVVKRKSAPPPKVRKAAAAGADGGETPKPKKSASSAFNKEPPKPKTPAGISMTLGKAQARERRATDVDFVDRLYSGVLADTLEARGAGNEDDGRAPPPGAGARNTSFSLYRDTSDPTLRARKTRPFSAAPTYGEVPDRSLKAQPTVLGSRPLSAVYGEGSGLHKLAPTIGGESAAATVRDVLQPAPGSVPLRPATASLLGHTVSHPALLKSTQARAKLTSSLLTQVHGHVHQQESLASVEAVKEALARSFADTGEHVRVSRSALEKALMPPRVYLTPDQQKMLPMQIANPAVNPLLDTKKKKRKKGRKGSSKKKGGGSSKKKKSSSSSSSSKKGTLVEPEGLSFPLGTATSEFASNPLVSDLALINIGDVANSEERPAFRHLYLQHASHLVLLFDFYSSRSGSGPPLMNQFQYMQFLHCCGVFSTPYGSAYLQVTPRAALEIFADSDDLSVENVDVDELLSRPAFLERLARIAVAKFAVKPLAPAPLGQEQPVQPRAMPPVNALESLLLKHVLPNALSVSSADIRMRMLAAPVQAVFHVQNIGLQAMFGHHAHPQEGTLSYEQVKLLLRDCDISPTASFVEKALRGATESMGGSDLPTVRLFFPELMELFARMADLATPSSDLASGLSAFLHNAWASFIKRVPSAMQLATEIAASHQATAGGIAPGSKTTTPRVKFS